MARKGLLDGLIAGTNAPPGADAPPDTADAPALPRRGTGAIGAVGRSFAEMRANSVIELPADMIDGAGLEDRLGQDDDLERLTQSIRDHGQQVPVLLRHSSNHEGRYDIVYGRRRVAALRVLRQPVRALVRDLTDRDLIVAQGQENTARKDLSFVEKALFAGRMVGMGFERKVICDALHVDKSQVSKMLQVAEGVPETLIRAIGPAPATGRDRWVTLARALPGHEAAALAVTDGPGDSDARFAAALAATRTRPPAPEAATADWGQTQRGVRGTTIRLPKSSDAFADWLLARMDDLHSEWVAGQARNPNKED